MVIAARADVVTDWNDKAVAAGVKASQAPFVHTRSVAIVHVAMFDAVNSIDRRYTPYRVQASTAAGASREAAAAAAAHFVLVRLYPDQAKDFDSFYQTSLAPVPDGEPKSKGIQLGEQVAAEILALRAKDGANAPNTYRPYTAAGTYVPTALPVGSSWGQVTPFALKEGSQFRPAAPVSLQSAQWAKDCDEVKKMGAKTGSGRTAEQTDIARLWEFTGPGLHNPVARQLAATKTLDVLDNARLFALYAMAMADSYIAVFDAKYTYNFWRPVTAIRNADIDGNNATERDSVWESFIPTPMHPEYPCAHCINSAAGAAVLAAFFGDPVPTFSLTSPTAPGVTRRFARLSDYVSESINARVYDGVHYRRSGEVGAAMGRKIGEYTVENYLKPVR
ncbi:MAG TPA: vanadium-dependent haloperoxidase [Candidatus Binatia bacterium]|nr:vanadium-dependent haloperoxidase [Candidatus Binatia bacterium]